MGIRMDKNKHLELYTKSIRHELEKLKDANFYGNVKIECHFVKGCLNTIHLKQDKFIKHLEK